MITRNRDVATNTKEAKVYYGMLRKCTAKGSHQYKNYGAIGVKVSPMWLRGFKYFLTDMGKAPSPDHKLMRAGNEGDYTSRNCFWADPDQVKRMRERTLMLKKEAALRIGDKYFGGSSLHPRIQALPAVRRNLAG